LPALKNIYFFIFEVISLLPCACFLALWKLQAGCRDMCLELLAGGYQSFAGRPASEAAKCCGLPPLKNIYFFIFEVSSL
jgi:hypothetical protein